MSTEWGNQGTSARLRALYEQAGARWVDLPVLHPADPFLETAGEDIRRKMFVTEGPRGERLALRPDFTIPVCLEHLKSGTGAARYAYEGLVFRRHDSGAPERLETGYEDLGREDRTAADAETLSLAVAAGAALGVGPLQVRLGDIGLFVAVLTALGLPDAWRRRLRRSFGVPPMMDANLDRLSKPRASDDVRLDPEIHSAADRHDRVSLVELLTDRFAAHGHAVGLGRTAEEIADRFLAQRELAETRFAPASLQAMRKFLAVETDLAAAPAALRRFSVECEVDLNLALQRFDERVAAIAQLAPVAAMRFEAGFGRPLDYYTGLVFELRAAGIPFPLAGGGRYDRLMEMLGGPAVPAVGFTMRLGMTGAEGAG